MKGAEQVIISGVIWRITMTFEGSEGMSLDVMLGVVAELRCGWGRGVVYGRCYRLQGSTVVRSHECDVCNGGWQLEGMIESISGR